MDSGRLLFYWRALCGFGAGEDRVVAAGAREEDRETYGAEHEDNGGVGGQLCEEVGRTARPEGRLRALTAEGTGEVGGLTLLKQDDSDEKQRDDNVKDDEKNDHRALCNLLGPGCPEDVWIGAEEGT